MSSYHNVRLRPSNDSRTPLTVSPRSLF